MTDSTIQRHPLFGVALPELGWVPAPRYLLRRDRVLRMLRPLPAGQVLEVGCGPGALIDDLARLGHSCQAVETSPDALLLARTLHQGNPRVKIRDSVPDSGAFDYLLSFEVLEHIEDDRGALAQWVRVLKPGGLAILSVPAHRKRWNPSDVWAGHFRRYERADLLDLLSAAGLDPVAIECYGFPLANIMEPIRGFLHGRDLKRQNSGDRARNTSRSGTERTYERRLYPFQASALGTLVMRINFAIQGLFIASEMGTGYLVMARKP